MDLQVTDKETNEKSNKNDQSMNIDDILDQENKDNKLESWNKLNKTMKIIKLNAYSEKYGKNHNFPEKKIMLLKDFFVNALDAKKLQRAKDVVYNKANEEITDIPGLHFNPSNRAFTLRTDVKRVSTLKSLTPKRLTNKNPRKEEIEKK